MRKRLIDLRTLQPLLDVASYGRRGPHQSQVLTQAEIAYIRRTVRRVPEVMIKVSGGARSLAGVRAHLDYIGREGRGDIETDEGATIRERGFVKSLVESWDLDLDAVVDRTRRAIAKQRKPPKLVHNLVFSMPKGTPPEKLQRAVRALAREKFAHRHRYAMALHTDQGHPHVHVVVRAMSAQGERLNIRKATLREWRRDFARHLRELGIEANATERAVRGEIRTRKTDGIYRAAMRGESRHHLERATKIARAVANDTAPLSFRSDRLRNTRDAVTRGWDAVAQMLDRQGEPETAALVRRFVQRMPAPRTENEQQLLDRLQARHREPVQAQPERDQLLTR
jgi:hypothetical protein